MLPDGNVLQPTYSEVIQVDINSIFLPLVIGSFTDNSGNSSPYIPSNPIPADGIANQNVYTNLSWVGGDPDGDPVTFDVYFEENDTTPDQLISNDQSGTYYYYPGTLNYNTHYYWQIIAKDEHGLTTVGPVWDFTTGSSSVITTNTITPTQPQPFRVPPLQPHLQPAHSHRLQLARDSNAVCNYHTNGDKHPYTNPDCDQHPDFHPNRNGYPTGPCWEHLYTGR